MSEEVKKQVKERLEREQNERITNVGDKIYTKNGVKKGKAAQKLVTIPTEDSTPSAKIEELFNSTRPLNLKPTNSQNSGK